MGVQKKILGVESLSKIQNEMDSIQQYKNKCFLIRKILNKNKREVIKRRKYL